MMIRFGILTVSSTCIHNPEKDLAGPKLEQEILKSFPDCQITFRTIVSDSIQEISTILCENADSNKCDVLFTAGGTGLADNDVTPEATKAVIDKRASGLEHAILSGSLGITPMAMLSRPCAGIRKNTLIVNFPGSAKASVECFSFIKSSISHAVALLRNETTKIKDQHEEIQQVVDLKIPSKVKIMAGASRQRNSPYPMLDVANALEIIRDNIPIITDTELVSIENALGRILAKDIFAPYPIPLFPASIKDGYAVRSVDGSGERKVKAAAAAAGDAPKKDFMLKSGEALRISTGAALPSGADAVVQIEDTVLVKVSDNDGEDEEIIKITVAPKIGQDIRQIGSDIPANSVVLNKYNFISSAYVGVLAMLGISTVKVIRRPVIGVISTGNELVHFKDNLKPGLIHDSNKVTLLTLLKTYNYEAVDCGIAKDTPDDVKSILEVAFGRCNFLISSGGVSMGEYDLLKQVLIQDFNAIIHVGRLNMKPGKPTVFATLSYKGEKKIIFALPGNPVSCCVTTILLVIPTLKYLEQDCSFKDGWPTIEVILNHQIINNDIRPEYVRMKISSNNSVLTGISTGNQISSRLNSMIDANSLLLIPGKTTFPEGHKVSVYLIGKLL